MTDDIEPRGFVPELWGDTLLGLANVRSSVFARFIAEEQARQAEWAAAHPWRARWRRATFPVARLVTRVRQTAQAAAQEWRAW